MCRVCRKLAADAARVAVTPTPTPKAAPKRDVPSRKPAAPAPAPKNPTPALFPPTQRPRARVQLRGLSIEIEGDSTAALGEVLATLARAFGGEG
jgi:hypothetical protein